MLSPARDNLSTDPFGDPAIFRRIVESAAEGVWVIDLDGRTLYANPRLCRMLATTPEQLRARHSFDYVLPEERESAGDLFRQHLAGEGKPFEFRLRREDGIMIWARISSVMMRNPDGSPLALVGLFSDITVRKSLEDALRDESARAALLHHLGKSVATEFDVPRITQIITDAGREATSASAGAFFFNLTASHEPLALHYALSGLRADELPWFPAPLARAMFDPAAHARSPLRISHFQPDPPGPVNLDVASAIAVPVVSRFGPVIGGLFYGHPEPDHFTPRDEDLLVGIAAHAAIAIDNARLLADARQASAAKDQFLAVLSHELRTPLNPALLAAGDMANDPALPPDVRERAALIRRNIELEARLIDDMLDLTRISRGKFDLHRRPVDIHALLHDVAAMFREELAAKPISLDFELLADHHFVLGDAARLHQVWWNLLKNAIKFTAPAGRIRIRTANSAPGGAESHEASDTPDLLVDVIDTGIGIDPQQLHRLFHAFQQADASISRRFGGLGLGLSISRSLIDAHGGSLSATSAGTDRGATFSALLPTVPAPAPNDPPPPTPLSHPPHFLRILLVEDHLDTARTMIRLIHGMGHHVCVAHSVAEAHHCTTRDGPFDLLLCDIGLPDGTGFDVLAHFRQLHSAPAVALTGFGMEDDIQRSRDAGFSHHLTKPINIDRLAHLLLHLKPV